MSIKKYIYIWINPNRETMNLLISTDHGDYEHPQSGAHNLGQVPNSHNLNRRLNREK